MAISLTPFPIVHPSLSDNCRDPYTYNLSSCTITHNMSYSVYLVEYQGMPRNHHGLLWSSTETDMESYST